MASENLIGVVTVTYNSESVLPDFLRCLAEQSHRDFLLFAVDNASKDNGLEILRDWGDERLRLIANENNRGVAEGNNQGICAALEAGCDQVLLINNDTGFGPELIAQLSNRLEEYQADITCPKILYYDEPDRIWAAGGEFQPWMGYRTIHFGVGQVDRGQYDSVRRITYAPTCCVLIRKDVFERIGIMDERYFVYVDDVDFMYRALKAKMTLIYLPELRLLHKVGRLTGGETSAFHIRYCARNRIYFILKHFGVLAAILIGFLYQFKILLDIVRRKLDIAKILLKERALFEGAKLWMASRDSLAKSESLTRST